KTPPPTNKHPEREHQKERPEAPRRTALEPEPEQHREGRDDEDAPGDPRPVRKDPPADDRRARDRQRTEPVDHTPLEVDVERDRGREREEADALHQDPRQCELQVLGARSRDRPTEHVDEQDQEHDRLDRHLDQLLGSRLDVEQVPSGDRERVRDDVRSADPRESHRTHALLLSSARPGSSSPSSALSSAACPVIARNTSSRLGRRNERSSPGMPSSSSRRTAGPSADLSRIVTETSCPSLWVPSSPSAKAARIFSVSARSAG